MNWHRYLTFLILFFAPSIFAGQNPIPPGLYRGLMPLPESRGGWGEIEFRVERSGIAHLRGAIGTGIMNGAFDLNLLVPDSNPIRHEAPEVQEHLNHNYAVYHIRSDPKAAIYLVANYLVPSASFADTEYSTRYEELPAIEIALRSAHDDLAVLLFTETQVAKGYFSQQIQRFEDILGSGAIPRLKTGGLSYKSCIEAIERAAQKKN